MKFVGNWHPRFEEMKNSVTGNFFLSLVLSVLITGCAWHRDKEIATDSNHSLGIPCRDCQLIDRTGFSIGYSGAIRQPHWVSYLLTAENLRKVPVKRTNKFKRDPLIENDPVEPEEYIRTGFDRGHLAPAADMAHSSESMENSFYMSNISPQLPALNRKRWRAVETLIRDWAIKEEKLYIITGPVFVGTPTLKGDFRVPVPQFFYKAVLDLTPPYKMIGFLIPNGNPKAQLRTFTVPVDRLEELTGCDFFSALNDDLENILEAQCSFDQWEE